MSDLSPNHIVGFPTRRLIYLDYKRKLDLLVFLCDKAAILEIYRLKDRIFPNIFKMGIY